MKYLKLFEGYLDQPEYEEIDLNILISIATGTQVTISPTMKMSLFSLTKFRKEPESEDFGDRVSIPDREFTYILEMIRKIFSDGSLDPQKIHISVHKSKSSNFLNYGPFSTNHDYLEIKYGPQYGPADSDIIISKYEDEWFQVYFRKSHGLKYNIKTYKYIIHSNVW